MSPAEVRLLMHYYAIAEAVPESPFVKDQTKSWLNEGIIEPFDLCNSGYRTTRRGNAWVEMILATPMPVEAWIDPRERKRA